MTKTSSIVGSGGAAWARPAGVAGGAPVDGTRLTVTCICFGVIFLEGARCQRSEQARATAKPAPNTRTHPTPGVVERARVPVGLLPELKNWTRPNPVFGRSPLFAASGMANTIAKAAYRKEAQPPKNATPAKIPRDRKSTRLNSSHLVISYAVFCLKKKKITCQMGSIMALGCPSQFATRSTLVPVVAGYVLFIL